MSQGDWKNFLLKYKWLPVSHLMSKFGIKRHDFNNFLAQPNIRQMLEPWRIRLTQPPERLRAILSSAWQYYLHEEVGLDVFGKPRDWVPKLIALKGLSRSSGFTFLVDGRYLEVACPKEYAEFRASGFTNTALGVYEFWPGRDHLIAAGVLPFMFHQTHRAALIKVDPQSMIEHVYLNFLAAEGPLDSGELLALAKEIFFARHNEQSFLTKSDFAKFGVPENFYNREGGLRAMLASIAHQYGVELGYLEEADSSWSTDRFRRSNEHLKLSRCRYCKLMPVDLHHLLDRATYPQLTYDEGNVVPLCVQVHQYITHGLWEHDEAAAYQAAQNRWLNRPNDANRTEVFDEVMLTLHGSVYGHGALEFHPER